MASTTANVPAFYSFFFKNLDPIIALGGVYLNFFDPKSAVTSMAPASTYDPNQVFLFHQTGGFALAIAVMSAAIPRYTNDIGVWRIFQGALLLSDFAGLSGVYNAMARQDRLAPSAWTSDDKGCGGVYVAITVVRLAFMLGLGFSKTRAGKKA